MSKKSYSVKPTENYKWKKNEASQTFGIFETTS